MIFFRLKYSNGKPKKKLSVPASFHRSRIVDVFSYKMSRIMEITLNLIEYHTDCVQFVLHCKRLNLQCPKTLNIDKSE